MKALCLYLTGVLLIGIFLAYVLQTPYLALSEVAKAQILGLHPKQYNNAADYLSDAMDDNEAAKPWTELNQAEAENYNRWKSSSIIFYIDFLGSFFLTWTVGIAPAWLARHYICKRPLNKISALSIATFFYFFFIICSTAMQTGLGIKPTTQMSWFFVAWASYVIMRWKAVVEEL